MIHGPRPKISFSSSRQNFSGNRYIEAIKREERILEKIPAKNPNKGNWNINKQGLTIFTIGE